MRSAGRRTGSAATSGRISATATGRGSGIPGRARSTWRGEKLVEQLGVKQLSKSQGSEMAQHLDAQVEAFRNRPLDSGHYTFVWLDALVIKVRENGRTVNVHALVAVGVNADGQREVLGLDVASGAALPGAAWQRCRTHYLRNLLTKVPKSAQPWVATLVRTVFDQPDADAVHAQYARVVATIEAKFPAAAEHLEAARDELLYLPQPRGDHPPVW